MSETALVIKVTGEVQFSNMGAFEEDARLWLDGINTELVTDQQFGVAKVNVKECKDKEVKIANALQGALMSMDEISKIITSGERVSSEVRDKRLMLEKLVKAEEVKRKKEITDNGIVEVETHLSSSSVGNGFIFDRSRIISAIKDKKSLLKMEEAVADVVINIMDDIDILSEVFNQNVNLINEAQDCYPGLFPDKLTQALQPVEQVSLLITTRVNEFKVKKAEADERDRVAKERADKEEKERLAKIEADRLAKIEADKLEVIKQEPEVVEKEIRSHREMVVEKEVVESQPEPFIEPLTEEQTYTITFHLTGSEQRKDQLCERLRSSPGVSNVTGG